MAGAALSYRVRIRNASTAGNPNGTADDLVLTSIRGGTNPVLSAEPSGDGQEVDPLTGEVRTGSYTIQLADPISSGTSRVYTQKLFDSEGRQIMLSRRVYVEISDDGGSSWDSLIAGYMLTYRLVDAITWELTIGDTRRIERNRIVFDGSSTSFGRRGCIFGGPITGGGWGSVSERGGWTFEVRNILARTSGDHIVYYNFIRGFRGINDPLSERLGDLVMADGVTAFSNKMSNLVQSYYTPSIAPYAAAGYQNIVAVIAELTGAANGGRFTPAALDTNLGQAFILSINGFGGGGAFAVFWPAAITLPSVGDTHTIYTYATRPSNGVSPIYVTDHPVDIVTTLWDDNLIPYDATAAAAVRTLLGDTLRVSLRIADPIKLLDFLTNVIFGPFGISARTNAAGEQELFPTRLKQSAVPTVTFDTDSFQDDADVVFENDEATVVTSCRFRTRVFWAFNPNTVTTKDTSRPLDSVYEATNEVLVSNGDTTAYGEREVVFDIPGFMHDVNGIAQNMDAFTKAVAQETFDRYGRGAPSGEFGILRGLDGDVQIGDEVYLEPAHLPNLNKRFGDDPTVGARIVQILRRTETPSGPRFKYIDAGSDEQPVVPAAVITLAANADRPTTVAEFTITNAAAINATAVLTTAVQWATGSSAPTDGVAFIRYAPGDVPVDAVQLPPVVPGSTIFVRARTEEDGRRPSAWTAWETVDLDGLPVPTALSITTSGYRNISFSWTNTDDTLQSDFFVYGPVPQSTAATALVAGRTYKIFTVGTSDFTLAGAIQNTVGVFFVATGTTTGTGTAQEVPLGTSVGSVFAAGCLAGETYVILSVGTTDWTLIGAASNASGVIFVATGAGTGTGYAQQLIDADDAWVPYLQATAQPAATQLLVNTPPPGGVGTYYFVAFCYRDPLTGQRGQIDPRSNMSTVQTSNHLTTLPAPGVSLINTTAADPLGSLQTGVVLSLQRKGTLDMAVERAPDSSGSPGTWAEIGLVAASADHFIDALPLSSGPYWYRVTHRGPSNTDNYSAAVQATPSSIPLDMKPPLYDVNNQIYVGAALDALQTAITNLDGSGTIELPAYGTVSIVPGVDIDLPVGVMLRSNNGAAKALISGDGSQMINVTGAPAGYMGAVLENLVLDGVGVVLGAGSSDSGLGSALQRVEVKNVTTGIVYRYNSFLTAAIDCFVHACTTGILFDFATASSNAGALMNLLSTRVFNCATGVKVDGDTLDGHHINITDCDLEHCSLYCLDYAPDGEGDCFLTNVHMELNDPGVGTDSYIHAVGGNLHINSLVLFAYGTVHNRVFLLDGGARVLMHAGRLQWEPDKLVQFVDDNSVLILNSDQIVTNVPFFGTDSQPMEDGSSAGTGRILNGGPGIGLRRAKEFIGQDNVNSFLFQDASGPSGSLPPYGGTGATEFVLATLQAYDAAPRQFEFDVEVTIGAATQNTLTLFLNPGGTIACTLVFPVASGGCRVKVHYTPGGALRASCTYNGTFVSANATDTNGHTVQRYLTAISVNTLSGSTMDFYNFCEYVH